MIKINVFDNFKENKDKELKNNFNEMIDEHNFLENIQNTCFECCHLGFSNRRSVFYQYQDNKGHSNNKYIEDNHFMYLYALNKDEKSKLNINQDYLIMFEKNPMDGVLNFYLFETRDKMFEAKNTLLEQARNDYLLSIEEQLDLFNKMLKNDNKIPEAEKDKIIAGVFVNKTPDYHFYINYFDINSNESYEVASVDDLQKYNITYLEMNLNNLKNELNYYNSLEEVPEI